jgi:phospholipase C
MDGNLSDDKSKFEIAFYAANQVFGGSAAGSPFNVYAPGKYAVYDKGRLIGYEAVRTWAYAVRAGDKLNDQWRVQDFENGTYQLRVYAANGFFREFTGGKDDPEITITVDYERMRENPGKLSGNIALFLKNQSKSEKYIIDVIDTTYKRSVNTIVLDKAGSTKIEVLDLSGNFNWYDIKIKVRGSDLFEKRYAGRVETGRAGKTDPFMRRLQS